MEAFDLRSAVNSISDVIQNRPLPLRQFDQIYMKAGDMVAQAVFMAKRFDKMNVIFIGDGDSIALGALHLRRSGVIDFGPDHILLLDFDERIVSAATYFADKYNFSERMEARLYNVFDPLSEAEEKNHRWDSFRQTPGMALSTHHGAPPASSGNPSK